MPTSICPECSEEVYVDADSEQGDNITCDECSTKLVIVGLDPFELDPYEEPDGGGSDADDFQSDDYDDHHY